MPQKRKIDKKVIPLLIETAKKQGWEVYEEHPKIYFVNPEGFYLKEKKRKPN